MRFLIFNVQTENLETLKESDYQHFFNATNTPTGPSYLLINVKVDVVS